jgi:hypothetical protein
MMGFRAVDDAREEGVTRARWNRGGDGIVGFRIRVDARRGDEGAVTVARASRG